MLSIPQRRFLAGRRRSGSVPKVRAPTSSPYPHRWHAPAGVVTTIPGSCDSPVCGPHRLPQTPQAGVFVPSGHPPLPAASRTPRQPRRPATDRLATSQPQRTLQCRCSGSVFKNPLVTSNDAGQSAPRRRSRPLQLQPERDCSLYPEPLNFIFSTLFSYLSTLFSIWNRA